MLNAPNRPASAAVLTAPAAPPLATTDTTLASVIPNALPGFSFHSSQATKDLPMASAVSRLDSVHSSTTSSRSTPKTVSWTHAPNWSGAVATCSATVPSPTHALPASSQVGMS